MNIYYSSTDLQLSELTRIDFQIVSNENQGSKLAQVVLKNKLILKELDLGMVAGH